MPIIGVTSSLRSASARSSARTWGSEAAGGRSRRSVARIAAGTAASASSVERAGADDGEHLGDLVLARADVAAGERARPARARSGTRACWLRRPWRGLRAVRGAPDAHRSGLPALSLDLRASPGRTRAFSFGEARTPALQRCLVHAVHGPERFWGELLLRRPPLAARDSPARGRRLLKGTRHVRARTLTRPVRRRRDQVVVAVAVGAAGRHHDLIRTAGLRPLLIRSWWLPPYAHRAGTTT